jgi:hypothetical protein
MIDINTNYDQLRLIPQEESFSINLQIYYSTERLVRAEALALQLA